MKDIADLLSTTLQIFQQVPWFFYGFVTIFGLMVGSFLNVVIYRLPIMMERDFKAEYEDYFFPDKPKEELPKFNLSTPRSRCPNCGHWITAIENVPILSYVFLRGKCSGCKNPISIRYPLVEAFTGIMSFVVAYHFGPTTQMLGALAVTWSLIALSGIDFDKMLLPDEIVLPLMWAGILYNTFCDSSFVDYKSSIIGCVCGYLILWTIYWVFKIITKKEGMGYGDFKLTACLGAWLGVNMLPAIILGSAFVGAIIGGIYIFATRNKTESKAIPFGPYIALAGFIVMLYGTEINNWYIDNILR